MAILTNKATAEYNLLGVNLSIDSNIVSFEKVVNVLTVTKSVNPTVGKSGDIVEFTITVLATSAITNTVVIDNLIGFTFISGSVEIDGVSEPSANPNTGINLGDVALGVLKTITFNATVD